MYLFMCACYVSAVRVRLCLRCVCVYVYAVRVGLCVCGACVFTYMRCVCVYVSVVRMCLSACGACALYVQESAALVCSWPDAAVVDCLAFLKMTRISAIV